MSNLASFLGTALLVWLGLMAGLIAMRMLSGRIPVRGLLLPRPGESVAPERMVAAAMFPIVLAMFAHDALVSDVVAHPSLPNVSDDVIALLTGSNVLYLSGKLARKP